MKRFIKPAALLIFIGAMFFFPQEKCFAEAKAKLQVGVFESVPFAFKDELGNWHGISVDLWVRVAKDLDLEYDLVDLTELQALTELSGGKLDLIIGGLAVTPEIEKIVDFTQPYYASDLAIGVMREKAVNLAGSLLELFFSWRFLLILGGLLALLLIIGTIFWLIEKDSDREGFGDTWFSAIVYGLYWAGAMMTGAGEKGPRTIHGRLVALVWIFLGLFITSTFTASVATMLTTKHYTQKISSERDLPQVYVGAVQGTCENLLRKMGVRVLTCKDTSTCFEKLMKGEIDAFVGAEPMLENYAADKYRGKLDIIMMDYQEVFFSFGINKSNELYENINRAIIRITASSEWADTLRRYLDY